MPTVTLEVPAADTEVTAGLHAANYTDLQTLLNGGLDGANFSTAAALALGALGVTFGSDVNFYRSAANVGKTDDDFAIGATGFVLSKDGFVALAEMAEPAAPAANFGRLFLKDDGSGNTQLCIRFSSGSTIVLATQGGSGTSTDRTLITGFGLAAETSGVTNKQMRRYVADDAGAGGDGLNVVVMPRAGSITGLTVDLGANRTAGTATFEVWKNAVATGLTAVIDGTNVRYGLGTQAAGTDTFVARDQLDVRLTTDGSWAAAGNRAEAVIEVQFT